MAIRLRIVEGTWIALCAVESDPKEGDIYLDDAHHEALSDKFQLDYASHMVDLVHPETKRKMDSQKMRDAEEAHHKWAAENSEPE